MSEYMCAGAYVYECAQDLCVKHLAIHLRGLESIDVIRALENRVRVGIGDDIGLWLGALPR